MDKISLIFAVSREMILKRFENKPEVLEIWQSLPIS